jgi:CRISPR-associated endonuclease Csn1
MYTKYGSAWQEFFKDFLMETKILGLDIGIKSIGFALLSMDNDNESGSIVCHGVHMFDRAEGDKGESLALPYRTNRSARRVTRRRAGRLSAIRRLFKQHGLDFYGPELNQSEVSAMGSMSQETSPWELRAKALTELLSTRDFCRALYHIAKHRGFQSNKKGEILSDPDQVKEKDLDDTGKMLKYANSLQARMQEAGMLTPGSFFYETNVMKGQKVRNSGDDYSHTILRKLHREEILASMGS